MAGSLVSMPKRECAGLMRKGSDHERSILFLDRIRKPIEPIEELSRVTVLKALTLKKAISRGCTGNGSVGL